MDTPKQARCELCQSGSLEDFLVPEKLQILKCPECGLYQKGVSLVGVDYARDYHQGYDRRRASKVRTAMVRLSRLTRLAGSASGRLLDVGCSVGCTLEAARRMGWEAVGTDVSADAVSTCQQHGFQAHEYDGESLPFPDAHFDVITSWHVIEHVQDVRDTLAEWHRVLKPGGWVMIETPNGQCRKVERRGPSYRRFWAHEHTYTFNRPTLEQFFCEAQFQVFAPPRLPPLGSDWARFPYALAYQSYQGLRRVAGVDKAFQVVAQRAA